VQLSFAVDEAGKIYTPVVKSEKMGYGLEEEAIRVIQKMPKWNPGSIKGKNVKTRFEIPVTYVIN
jgi:protein TonB